MKLPAVTILAALATPGFAQTPPIDWSKPVVGVDAPALKDGQILEDTPLPVEILTIQEIKSLEDLKKLPDRVVDVFIEKPTRTPPPCEPAPTANGPAAKPAGPSPCPATR